MSYYTGSCGILLLAHFVTLIHCKPCVCVTGIKLNDSCFDQCFYSNTWDSNMCDKLQCRIDVQDLITERLYEYPGSIMHISSVNGRLLVKLNVNHILQLGYRSLSYHCLLLYSQSTPEPIQNCILNQSWAREYVDDSKWSPPVFSQIFSGLRYPELSFHAGNKSWGGFFSASCLIAESMKVVTPPTRLLLTREVTAAEILPEPPNKLSITNVQTNEFSVNFMLWWTCPDKWNGIPSNYQTECTAVPLLSFPSPSCYRGCYLDEAKFEPCSDCFEIIERAPSIKRVDVGWRSNMLHVSIETPTIYYQDHVILCRMKSVSSTSLEPSHALKISPWGNIISLRTTETTQRPIIKLFREKADSITVDLITRTTWTPPESVYVKLVQEMPKESVSKTMGNLVDSCFDWVSRTWFAIYKNKTHSQLYVISFGESTVSTSIHYSTHKMYRVLCDPLFDSIRWSELKGGTVTLYHTSSSGVIQRTRNLRKDGCASIYKITDPNLINLSWNDGKSFLDFYSREGLWRGDLDLGNCELLLRSQIVYNSLPGTVTWINTIKDHAFLLVKRFFQKDFVIVMFELKTKTRMLQVSSVHVPVPMPYYSRLPSFPQSVVKPLPLQNVSKMTIIWSTVSNHPPPSAHCLSLSITNATVVQNKSTAQVEIIIDRKKECPNSLPTNNIRVLLLIIPDQYERDNCLLDQYMYSTFNHSMHMFFQHETECLNSFETLKGIDQIEYIMSWNQSITRDNRLLFNLSINETKAYLLVLQISHDLVFNQSQYLLFTGEEYDSSDKKISKQTLLLASTSILITSVSVVITLIILILCTSSFINMVKRFKPRDRSNPKMIPIVKSNDVEFENCLKYAPRNLIDSWKGKLLSSTVFIKRLKPPVTDFAKKKFVQTAGIQWGLKHRNIVQVIGLVMDKRGVLILFHYESGDLQKYLEDGCLKKPDLLKICSDLCAAGQYLESRNLVHRKFRTKSCVLSLLAPKTEFEVLQSCKLSDFELAIQKNKTSDEEVSILPSFLIRYSAPECSSMHTFSNKSDVWSFGVLVWQVHNDGAIPFCGKSDTESHDILSHIENGSIEVLEKLKECMLGRKKLSRNVKKVLDACWHKNYNARSDFAELLELLTKIRVQENADNTTLDQFDSNFASQSSCDDECNENDHLLSVTASEDPIKIAVNSNNRINNNDYDPTRYFKI